MAEKLQHLENKIMKKIRNNHPMAQLYGIPPGADMHYVRLYQRAVNRYGRPVLIADYRKGFDKGKFKAYTVNDAGKMKLFFVFNL